MKLIVASILVIASLYQTEASSVFSKKKDATAVLKSNELTQEEWNNELLFKLHLTSYSQWDKFLAPWSRYKIGKALKKCKKACMKKDSKGWMRGTKFQEVHEVWSEDGFDFDSKPDNFPCSECLTHFKVIQPRWKRIVEHLDAWTEAGNLSLQ